MSSTQLKEITENEEIQSMPRMSDEMLLMARGPLTDCTHAANQEANVRSNQFGDSKRPQPIEIPQSHEEHHGDEPEEPAAAPTTISDVSPSILSDEQLASQEIQEPQVQKDQSLDAISATPTPVSSAGDVSPPAAAVSPPPSKRRNDPYNAIVIPQSPEAIFLELERQHRVQLETRRRRAQAFQQHLVAAAAAQQQALCSSPMTPYSPLILYDEASATAADAVMNASFRSSSNNWRCASCDDLLMAPAPLHQHHHFAVQHSAQQHQSHFAPHASRIPSSAVLVKVYQNGRPVPKVKAENDPAPSPTINAIPTESVAAVVETSAVPQQQTQTAAAPVAPPTQSPLSAQQQKRHQQQTQQGGARDQRQQQQQPQQKSSNKQLLPNTQVIVQMRHSMSVFLLSAVAASQLQTHRKAIGQYVTVDGDRGVDLGQVAEVCFPQSRDAVITGTVQRRATEDEIHRHLHVLPQDDQRAAEFADQAASKLLPNRLSIDHACFQFDKKKLTLWYRSPERVYFVPLLKALNTQFKCRIWMVRMEECGELPSSLPHSPLNQRQQSTQESRSGGFCDEEELQE